MSNLFSLLNLIRRVSCSSTSLLFPNYKIDLFCYDFSLTFRHTKQCHSFLLLFSVIFSNHVPFHELVESLLIEHWFNSWQLIFVFLQNWSLKKLFTLFIQVPLLEIVYHADVKSLVPLVGIKTMTRESSTIKPVSNCATWSLNMIFFVKYFVLFSTENFPCFLCQATVSNPWCYVMLAFLNRF